MKGVIGAARTGRLLLISILRRLDDEPDGETRRCHIDTGVPEALLVSHGGPRRAFVMENSVGNEPGSIVGDGGKHELNTW